MRSINTNSVNVVHDHTDRVNVVVSLRGTLRCLRALRRAAWDAIAACKSPKAKYGSQISFAQAMAIGIAASPSWGDHRWSGGSGHAIRS